MLSLMTMDSLSLEKNYSSKRNQTGSLMVMRRMISKSKVNMIQMMQLFRIMDSASLLVTGLNTHGQTTNTKDP